MLYKNCIVCGNQFTKPLTCSTYRWSIKKSCSKPCYYKSKIGKSPWNKGKTFSEAFKKKVSDGVKLAYSEGRLTNPWSRKGRIPWNKIDFSSPIRSKIYSISHEWRKKIYERDNYICQECGQRGGHLNAHHIFPTYRIIREERWDLVESLENGITLCIDCHKLTESYGTGQYYKELANA